MTAHRVQRARRRAAAHESAAAAQYRASLVATDDLAVPVPALRFVRQTARLERRRTRQALRPTNLIGADQ